ncbi:hypothetical protein [Flavitalea sp.]|nr:hypothetical protein [Flavitalea sp.]
MNSYEMFDHISQRLERIERLLRNSRPPAKRKTWIKVSQVRQITPWKTKDQLRTARETGLIECKRDKNGFSIYSNLYLRFSY